ncbi:MAG: fumarate hydratase [Spirochaetia bacterium]|nr:fumarate hydratase [Spirochaetia bacterium]
MLENEKRFNKIEGEVPENRINLFVNLIKEASSNLPGDVVKAIKAQKEKEEEGSQAKRALGIIIENFNLAYEKKTPICQDTGTVIFHIHYPIGMSVLKLKEELTLAVQEATKKGYLRPNAVDSISGKNSGDNCGFGSPSFYADEWEKDILEIKIMLKGGGCENVGAQYTLPDTKLEAGRDIKGVKKVILDAVVKAQGKGCAPGIIGVGIGGDRVSGALAAKNQIFRYLEDENLDNELAQIEKELYEKSNQLGIGPMGFGGKTTVLGVKCAKLHRVPASFFVSISYMCWAARRKTLEIKNNQFTIK